jgi:hypothetical protein
MNFTDFARIRNAKPLLLTPEKRVLHFPKTNKVRIDNILSNELDYERPAGLRSSRKEYANADVAAKTTTVVPPVQNYRERGNMTSYTQDYAGKPFKGGLEGISMKEQYKLGSQVGRMQNRLREQNLGHTDIHAGNIVRPNANKRQVKLIDNEAIKNIEHPYDEHELKKLYHEYSFEKPFMTGYNSRINFTQQKPMQHFANFALPTGFADTVAKAAQNNNPFKNPKAYGGAIKDLYNNSNAGAAIAGANIGSYTGAAAGIAKGAGIGETEEEKANTTGLGRAGKIFGGYVGGSLVGAGLGAGAAVGSRYIRGKQPQSPQG